MLLIWSKAIAPAALVDGTAALMSETTTNITTAHQLALQLRTHHSVPAEAAEQPGAGRSHGVSPKPKVQDVTFVWERQSKKMGEVLCDFVRARWGGAARQRLRAPPISLLAARAEVPGGVGGARVGAVVRPERAEGERLARLPKPARASFAVLKTHARLAAARRRCGEAETSRRAEAEAARAGAARAAEAARARVAADTSAATEAAAFAVEAEAAATILQSAVRGHLARKRWKRSDLLEKTPPAAAPVASSPRTRREPSAATPGSVASSPRSAASRGARGGGELGARLKDPSRDAEGRYDESTQTPPEVEQRATQTPPRRLSPAAASLYSAPSPQFKNSSWMVMSKSV